MTQKTAMTVNRAREEVERLWRDPDSGPELSAHDATVEFADAPGDRGTEIRVELAPRGRGRRLLGRVGGSMSLARVKDELRRFKQRVETGEIPRSDATPEGERAARKLRQRPAQPLEQSELEKVGA